jgi:hypothetical protein
MKSCRIFEKELIIHTLEQYRYNLTRTAEHLKISRHALRYRMQRLNIHAETDNEDECDADSGQGGDAMLTQLTLLAAQTTADLQAQLPPPSAPSELFGLRVRDILLLVGVIAIIALVLYVFAYITRRKRRRRISRSGPEMWGADRHAQSERREGRVRIRKKRRKHPDFRPRNPTLGETGGLPPVRPDEPAQPAT